MALHSSDEWNGYFDDATGAPYWTHRQSGEATWDDPGGDEDDARYWINVPCWADRLTSEEQPAAVARR
jgi:hypothetical protein